MKDSALVIEGAIQEIIMILTSSRINSADHQQEKGNAEKSAELKKDFT